MQTKILRTLRKYKNPISIDFLSKQIGRSEDDIRRACDRMKKIVLIDGDDISLIDKAGRME